MCLKHGNGTDSFNSGDVYTGEYFDGKPQGKGEYSWANSQYYNGEFHKGLKHGKGRWKSSKNAMTFN
jgi:hypothetical protein